MMSVLNSVEAHAERGPDGELTPESKKMLAGVYGDVRRLLNPA